MSTQRRQSVANSCNSRCVTYMPVLDKARGRERERERVRRLHEREREREREMSHLDAGIRQSG